MPLQEIGAQDDRLLQDIADRLVKSHKILLITGAGISTSCGIPVRLELRPAVRRAYNICRTFVPRTVSIISYQDKHRLLCPRCLLRRPEAATPLRSTSFPPSRLLAAEHLSLPLRNLKAKTSSTQVSGKIPTPPKSSIVSLRRCDRRFRTK